MDSKASSSPQLVGVLNVTPDSFSDGGKYQHLDASLKHVEQMIHDGVHWIDVGGESSGPGSVDVTLQEEQDRVLPIIEAIRQRFEIPLMVDTYKAQVAKEALCLGANAINDVTALRGDTAMTEVLAQTQAPVVLMYSKNDSARTTTTEQHYSDVIQTLLDFFDQTIQQALNAGLSKKQLILDPGMGFFVSGVAQYSFEILARLQELKTLDCPLFVGTSRKSFLANVVTGTTLPPVERDLPSAITSAIALQNGAQYLRVHNVAYGNMVLGVMKELSNHS